jgi:hypothetical protein
MSSYTYLLLDAAGALVGAVRQNVPWTPPDASVQRAGGRLRDSSTRLEREIFADRPPRRRGGLRARCSTPMMGVTIRARERTG